jgi:hypothetical protein
MRRPHSRSSDTRATEDEAGKKRKTVRRTVMERSTVRVREK